MVYCVSGVVFLSKKYPSIARWRVFHDCASILEPIIDSNPIIDGGLVGIETC